MSPHNHPITQEPYLRLPSPHQSIIITPYRAPNPADEAAQVRNMNDPLVSAWLIGPPYPYHADDAKIWTNMSRSQCIQILEEAKTQQYVSGSPFRCVRKIVEEDEQGVIQKDVLIGGIDITEYPFLEFAEGSREREDGVKRNMALETGSTEKVWEVGDWLDPAYHGRGIMTTVVKTVINDWAIPRMNARHFKVSAFVGNQGSVRVFEKLGFKHHAKLDDWVQMPASRGGGRKSLHILSLDVE